MRARSCAVSRTVALIVTTGVGMLAPAASLAAPIIQEVHYDAVGPDAAEAFTELFGPAGLSLDGWTLVGINGGTGSSYRTLDLTGAVLPADGLLVIATDRASAALVTHRDWTANVDWQNGPEAVQLLDPAGLLVDALQYGDASPHNHGFGTPAPDAPAGSSLSRDLVGTNTMNNAVDFTVGTPSPGLGPPLGGPPVQPAPPPAPQPPRSVPEPSTLALVLLSLTLMRLRYN